jgi:hypothetical protein
MLFDTISEYDEEIEITRTNIRRQLTVGAETSNNSGGSSRSTGEVDLDKARAYLTQLRREKKILAGDRDCVFIGRMGW